MAQIEQMERIRRPAAGVTPWVMVPEPDLPRPARR